MPTVRYVGPFDAVDIRPNAGSDEWVTVAHGDLVDVDDDENYLTQPDNWQAPDGPPAAPAARKPRPKKEGDA